MSKKVYLRKLTINDTAVSYKWRNNSNIWVYTKFRPAPPITLEMEQAWLQKCQAQNNECRLAICLQETDEYIGNVQIIGIRNGSGEFHLFIGDEKHWGKGYGKEASTLILQHGFETLNLDNISLEVHHSNAPAIAIYKKMGFKETAKADGNFVTMNLNKSNYLLINKITSKAVPYAWQTT
jgi:RimJ/RimL family protein N-acetyltransferase